MENKKKYLLILLAAIAVLCIALFMKFRKNTSPQPNIQIDAEKQKLIDAQAVEQQAKQKENQIIDNTWKTVESDFMGMNFYYPKNWKIDKEKSGGKFIFFDTGSGSDGKESIVYEGVFEGKKLEELTSNYYMPDDLENKSDIAFNGIPGIKIQRKSNPGSAQVLFMHGGNLYIIITSGKIEESGMLDTITFINREESQSTNQNNQTQTSAANNENKD